MNIYVRMDTFWQNSPDRWFGPFDSREAAESAIEASAAHDNRTGNMARDIKNQTRILGVYSASESKRLGRNYRNEYPVVGTLPGSTAELLQVENAYPTLG